MVDNPSLEDDESEKIKSRSLPGMVVVEMGPR